MTTIFITGVAGFLGSHLADRFLASGYKVKGNDNLMGGYADNVPNGVEYFQSDCCNLNQMSDQIKGSDIVIHCAATPHEGLSVFSPYFITNNIFQASVSVITASIQNNVKKFVFCSSMARYGNQEYPYIETMQPAPVDPYAIAKVAAEDVLKSLAPMNNMDWVIAIPHNIVGPRQRFDDPYRNVMSIMINRVLQGKPPVIYGDGSQMRCFSYIDDCIYCLERLALDPSIKNDTYNIGPDEEFVTIKELADMICDELNFTEDHVYMPDRPKEIKFATCSADKARRLLSYTTKTKLIDSIKHTINYINSKGPRPFSYDYDLEIINHLTPQTWSKRLM